MNRARIIWSIIAIKLTFVFLSIFAPFSHPHIIRQDDTLGIVIRYWLRWTQEPAVKFPLFPALIQAGDAYGIHATEFPILYILFAPLMSLPMPWGAWITRLTLILTHLALVFISYKIWSKNDDEKIDHKIVHGLLLIFGIGSVFFSRFMPDFSAFILVILALGLSWKKPRIVSSIWLATLGLLIKPTAILGLGYLLTRDIKTILNNCIKWIMPATLIALCYYLFGTKALNAHSDIPIYFYSNFREPIGQLLDFFREIRQAPKLFFKNIFSGYLLVIIIFDFFHRKIYKNTFLLKLWGILVLQIFAGALLDGKHSYIHDYYFISTSFTVALILSEYLNRINKKLFYFSTFIILFAVTERGFYELRGTFSDNIWVQCANLSDKIPRSEYKIRTRKTNFAKLGTCMGKKQNSQTADYGVYYQKNIDSLKLENYRVIEKTKDLILVKFKKD